MIDGLANIAVFAVFVLVIFLIYNFLPIWLFLPIVALFVVSKCRNKADNDKRKKELEEAREKEWKIIMDEFGIPADDKGVIKDYNSSAPYFDKDKGIEIWPAWYPDENRNPVLYK